MSRLTHSVHPQPQHGALSSRCWPELSGTLHLALTPRWCPVPYHTSTGFLPPSRRPDHQGCWVMCDEGPSKWASTARLLYLGLTLRNLNVFDWVFTADTYIQMISGAGLCRDKDISTFHWPEHRCRWCTSVGSCCPEWSHLSNKSSAADSQSPKPQHCSNPVEAQEAALVWASNDPLRDFWELEEAFLCKPHLFEQCVVGAI